MVLRAVLLVLSLASAAAGACVPMGTPAETAPSLSTQPIPAAPATAQAQASLDASDPGASLLYPYNLPRPGNDLAAVAR